MVPQVCQGQWVLKATRAQLEPPVPPECPVMESLVPTVKRERGVPLAAQELQAQRVSRVPLVTQVLLEPPDPLVQLDLRVLEAFQVKPAQRVQRVTLVPLDLRVLKDKREIRDHRDLQVNRATQVQLVLLDHREPLAQQETRDM